jgi:DNA-3-methyladenine glycosylase II
MKPIRTLHPRPPYNFALTLDILARYSHPTSDVAHDGGYWRVLRDGQSLALLRVDGLGTVAAPELAISLVTATGAVHHDALLAQMGHVLSVESDVAGFYRYASQEPTLWAVVEPLVGLRWLRTPSVFEALMTTVIEQQIAWTTAQKAQRWLVDWGGHHIAWDGLDFYAFPTPAQIAAATVEDLTPLKITFKRMQVMIDIARQVVAGQLNLEGLLHQPTDAAYKALVAIQGIGHWTATWTIQRSKGWHNYVGHNDVALQAAVNHYFYGGSGKIPEAQVVETFARYGDYAGMAANYTIMRWVLDRYERQS